MARRSQINKETKVKIYDLLMDGDTIAMVARKLSITRQTIYKWRNKHADLREMIDNARENYAHILMEDALEVVNNRSRDMYKDEYGNDKPNSVAVGRDKLISTTMTKLAAKYNPEYADNQKIDITSNGNSVFGGLMITTKEVTDVDKK